MVAIIKQLKYWGLAIASLTICSLNLASAAVKAPIPELSGDSTYMALLGREDILTNKVDSLSSLLAQYRDEYSAGGAEAAQAKSAIVDIEMELFDLRGEQNSVNEKVTNIEQKWSLNNVSTQSDDEQENGAGDTARTIAQSKIAQKSIPAIDYQNLKIADSVETKCAAAYSEYIKLYEKMRELLELYNQCENEEEASTYSTEFHTLSQEASRYRKTLEQDWSSAYDNKTFAYSMLMEVMNYDDLLNKSSEMAHKCDSEIAAVDIESESSAVVKYHFQKRNMVALEKLVANKLHLQNAVDSLDGAAIKLSKIPTLEELPALTFTKRNFMLFEPILFSTTPTYNASNPIPETVIYKKGTIYRIHYGAFNSKQSPSIFHGAYPLSYERDGGLWIYYGGGYATYAEAEAAAKLCKQKGFRRPEPVIWRNGVKRNLARDPFSTDQKYRVQIKGLSELPEEVRNIISTHCPDAELSKIGANSYVVGPVVGQLIVEEFATALEGSNEALTTNITELTEE